MPPRCIIPDCQHSSKCISKYENSKVHLFNIPNKDDVILKWQATINASSPPHPIILKPKQRICEKHFAEDDILSEKKMLWPDGTIAAVAPYQRKQLRKGAVPSIFPWMSTAPAPHSPEVSLHLGENSKFPSEFLNTSQEESETEREKIRRNEKLNRLSPNIHTASKVTAENDIPEPQINPVISEELPTNHDISSEGQSENVETSVSQSPQTPPTWCFESLLQDNTLILPPSWDKKISLDGQMKTVHYLLVSCDPHDRRAGILKQIIIDANMNCQVYVAGKEVDMSQFQLSAIFNSKQDIQNLLLLINGLNVCSGCIISNDLKQLDSNITYTDHMNQRRHRKCPLLSNLKQCRFCKTVRKTLLQKKNRCSKQRESKKRLNFAPHQRAFVTSLRKKLTKSKQLKKKLRESNIKLRQKIRESQVQMAKMSSELINDRMIKEKMSIHQRTAVQEIIEAAKCKGAKGRRYSESWMMLCMLLHMRSPSGYNFLRDHEILALPSVRTIRRNLAIIETTCGFDPRFFELFRKFLGRKLESQRHGILLVDEMATRENVSVNTTRMTYNGLVDFGDGTIPESIQERANHGLVFMFKSVTDSYTQPIAVFATRDATPGVLLAQLIIKAIILLEKAGAKIHGVVGDGAATNRKFWTEVGINCKRDSLRNSFPHPLDPSRKVFAFSDTPHLVKTIRNRLVNNKTLQMDASKSKIKWEHFEHLYEADKNLPGKMRICPNLKIHHLNLNNTAKMRVRLAVQVFSKSVAAGLRFYQHRIKSLEDCEETADFCEWINNLFDALNLKIDNNVAADDSDPTQKGLQPNNDYYNVLESSLRKLNDWEKKVEEEELQNDCFLTRQTAEGLRVSLQSMMDLTRYLTENYNIECVFSGQINQDNLEQFFGTVRRTGGCNDHPSTPTFLQIYKILSSYSILKPPRTGNCTLSKEQPEFLVTITELKELYVNKKKPSNELVDSLREKLRNSIEFKEWSIEDEVSALQEHDYSMPDIFDCLIYYAAEFFCSKVLEGSNCDTCRKALTENTHQNDPKTLYASIKLKDNLVHPHPQFYALIKLIEELFQKHCDSPFVYEAVITDAIDNSMLSFPCEDHAHDVLSAVIHHYVRMRMQKYAERCNNKQPKKHQVQKKLARLCKN